MGASAKIRVSGMLASGTQSQLLPIMMASTLWPAISKHPTSSSIPIAEIGRTRSTCLDWGKNKIYGEAATCLPSRASDFWCRMTRERGRDLRRKRRTVHQPFCSAHSYTVSLRTRITRHINRVTRMCDRSRGDRSVLTFSVCTRGSDGEKAKTTSAKKEEVPNHNIERVLYECRRPTDRSGNRRSGRQRQQCTVYSLLAE